MQIKKNLKSLFITSWTTYMWRYIQIHGDNRSRTVKICSWINHLLNDLQKLKNKPGAHISQFFHSQISVTELTLRVSFIGWPKYQMEANIFNSESCHLLKKGQATRTWMPNLMFLSRNGSFLLFEWLIFVFDYLTHSRVASFTAA